MIAALYVDDEPSLLEIAKAFLEREGEISVETSSSAMDALVRLETRKFDAIICDYQMPVVDGIQFLKTIRMQGRDIPFILFTGKGREDVAIEALNNGADFYLQKGGDPKAQFTELVNMLKRSIEHRRGAESIKESEEIYEKLFKENVEAMVLVDPTTGAIADVNSAATAFFGYSREQMLGMNIADTYPGLSGEELRAMGHGRIGQGTKIMMSNRLANGEVREVEVFSGMLRVKGRILGYAIIHDITEMRRGQRREERLNRVFKVLSITSQLILHSRSEIELLDGTCNALVQNGGYLAAWIGSYAAGSGAVHEVVRYVRKGACGADADFNIPDDKLSDLGDRVRRGEGVVVDKVIRDSPSTSLGDSGGMVTFIALPLQINEVLSGVVVIASDDHNAMEDNEAVLLNELADNMSEAISLIFDREREAIRLDESAAIGKYLQDMIRVSPSGVMVLDQDLHMIRLNPRALSILGKKESEAVGRSVLDVLPDARGSGFEAALHQVQATGMPTDVDHLLPFTYPKWFRITILPFKQGLGLLFNDITEDKEKDLRKTEELDLLRQMIETSPAGIMVLDERGEVTFANRYAEEVLGVPRGAFMGKAFNSPKWSLSALDGAPIPDRELPFAVVMRTGMPLRDFQLAAEPSPGDRRFLSINATPLKNGEGKATGVVMALQDITSTKAAEEERRESGAFLQELLSSTTDVILKLDGEGRMLFLSSGVKDLLGKEPKELIGKDVADLIHPDDLDRATQAFEEAIEQKGTLSVRLRLGREVGYVVVEVTGRTVFDQGNEPVSFVGSVRDITSRQMAEDKIWETGSKLRAIIQTSPMAIVSLDANGSINTWNPAAEKVFSWESVDNIRPFPFLPQDDSEATARLKERILAGEAVSDVEVRRKSSDGREGIVSISTAPIFDQAGKVSSIILVASDITERKGMEDRLIQLNDLLRLVNRILRHDTLNELMVLSGSLDMYQRTKQERFLTTATKAVNRSMEMIKRMKELESLAASGGTMKVYDLRQTVENILRGYMIEFSVDGEGSIYADDALPSAIDNIVRNAMIHGKADIIKAKVWTDERHCHLRISDNGIGIPDQVKRRIFEEGFSYGSNAGTGLGLYLVTRAVERYGGRVSVEDNQPKGAAFVLTFPKA